MWFSSDFDWSWSFKSFPQMLPDFWISYCDIVAAGCWTTQRPASENGPYTGHPPFDLYWIWIHRISLHREHLNISKYWFWLVLVGFGIQAVPVLILAGRWVVMLIFDLFICFSAAEELHSGKKKQLGAGLRCNAGHSTSFLSMRMCQMGMGRKLWRLTESTSINQPCTIRMPGFWATPRSGVIYISLQQKNQKSL